MRLSAIGKLAATATAALAGVALWGSVAAAQETIKIGVITDKTGNARFYAEPVLQGIRLAATLVLAPGQINLNPTLTVTVTNETGHKLPSGYPEGRRIWLNVKAWDVGDSLVYESGHYDGSAGVLTHDADAKICEIGEGTSEIQRIVIARHLLQEIQD